MTLALSVAANAAPYTFSSTNGNSIVPGTTDIGNHGDDTVVTVALPFQVSFYGTLFNSANLGANGNLQFSTSLTNFTNSGLPAAAFGPTMFVYWDDLYLVNSGFGIFTSTTGVAGSRTFNIEWRSQYFPGIGSANFEIQLYENQTYFDFVYGTLENGSDSATVGVQNTLGSGEFTQYSADTAGTLSSGQRLRWDVSAVGEVPEPASISLIALGGLALVGLRRFKRGQRA